MLPNIPSNHALFQKNQLSIDVKLLTGVTDIHGVSRKNTVYARLGRLRNKNATIAYMICFLWVFTVSSESEPITIYAPMRTIYMMATPETAILSI